MSMALTAGCMGGVGPDGAAAAGSGVGAGADGGSGGGGGGGVVVSDGGSGGVVVLSSELPCEAYDVLSAHCWTCHGTTPAGGAPQSLSTLAALRAMSPGYATQSNGQRSVVRMASTASPMPPAGYAAVPSADESAFAAWVSAGMPTGTCTTGGGSSGGGTPDAGPPPPPPPPDPLNDAPTCTSNSYWTSGTQGSSRMEPGWACIACHLTNGAPDFTVAGTVYPTGHEPDGCNGSAASGAVVTVHDAAGKTATFTANSAGNFSGTTSLTFPITASLSFNGKTRAMGTQVTTGDCNSCHAQNGTSGAPGRITLPP